jgi:hypothetical protein
VSPLLNLRTEIDPVSETLRFLVFRIPVEWQSPETQQFRNVYCSDIRIGVNRQQNAYFVRQSIAYVLQEAVVKSRIFVNITLYVCSYGIEPKLAEM